jgi:hypothetical protein
VPASAVLEDVLGEGVAWWVDYDGVTQAGPRPAAELDAEAYESENDRFYRQYQSGTLDIGEFLRFQLAPLAAHPLADVVDRACTSLTLPTTPTPRGLLSAARPDDDRLPCAYRQLCASYGCPTDAKSSMPATYLRRAAKTGNLTVWTETLCSKVLLDAAKKKATGVVVRRLSTGGSDEAVKAGVVVGLELGDPAWWLSQVDEQVMRCDARTAWERKELSTSSPIVHLVWRGGDKTSRVWLSRLESGRYALLAKLGRSWTNTEGDLSSVTATIPDAWFARAMAVVESRR